MRKEDIERWITMNGNHIPIAKGQSEEEAINEFIGKHYEKEIEPKSREYKKYWLKNEDSKFESYTGVSKREYEKALASGRTGRVEEYLRDTLWHRIPDDIENKVFKTLENMTEVTSPNSFKNQLRSALFKIDGVNSDNYQTIISAFTDEIEETYNILIEPQKELIKSIDVDNSYEVFQDKLTVSPKTSPNFKQNILNTFEAGENEECKIMLATIISMGTRFDQDEDEKCSCYHPLGHNITLLDGDEHSIETLYHECFHGVFDRYGVKNTDLKAVMKKELNTTKKIDSVYNYLYNRSAKRLNYGSYDEIVKEAQELTDKVNEIYNNELNKYELKTADAYRQVHEALDKNEEYKKLNNERMEKNRIKFKIERDTDGDLNFRYGNLNDIISGATRNHRGYGHTAEYWHEDKMNQANEFFAEMASMKATGDDEQYELIRTLAPNSVKKFEEIYNDIFKNRERALDLDL